MQGKKIRAGGAAGLLEMVAARGGSPERVLTAAGLTANDLADPDQLVDVERIVALFDVTARELAEDSFGLHLGMTYDLGSLGPLSYAVLNAPTVGTALRNFNRYSRAYIQGGRIALEVDGAEALLTYVLDVTDRELCRQHAEGAAVVGVNLLRRLIGPDWRPRRVLFGHSRPRDTSEHARIFGVPLRFREPVACAVVFDAAELERAVPGADRRLLPIVQRYLDELLAATSAEEGSEWLGEVRNAIAETVCDGPPTIRTIAKRLALSVRTLQRRLDDRGVVFKTLVAEMRRELALRYLADGKADLTEIAFLVGYSELSAFDRAFRRWTGTTPLAARKNLQGRSATL